MARSRTQFSGSRPSTACFRERSHGKIRADVAYETITAMGYAGSERTTRRAVALVKAHRAAGRRRVFRPWVPEPGMWAQYDFGDGPRSVVRCLAPLVGGGW
jgi:hypothetical protein